jgi:glycosyltransferase involved in cell wall biosynthesis
VRRIADGLRGADVPISTIAATRSASPPLPDAPVPDQRVAYETTLAVVTADQLPLLKADHPELFAATKRMIGYWFWELEYVPRAMRQSIALVDEIWTGSRFVADAFRAVSRVPVHHVPIPVPMPTASALGRSDFAPLAALGERTIFLVAFDHFSITERKNPVGAIEAFRAAFAPDEGPVLVVKSMNGDGRWPQHQRVVAAAAGRPDIVVWDEHLSRADQMALVASADCLVSLHRAEGLGLHLAEAMWLGTPTIATRYSGNLDFMDDECALLIDYELVHVTDGQGIYPPTATWADPDLDQAAAAMRRIASDRTFADQLAHDARARMVMQPSLADIGRLIGRMLHGGD